MTKMHKVLRFGLAVGLVLALAGCSTSAAPEDLPEFAQNSKLIEVKLNEFSITTPLEIPAGEKVTLVITNEGKVDHEFMAGREAHGGSFATDLFHGVEVQTLVIGEETEHKDDGDSHGDDGHKEDGDAHGGDGHGTMVTVPPGGKAYMTFTLPASAKGEWETGCFLAGHYEAGMNGKLIVQ